MKSFLQFIEFLSSYFDNPLDNSSLLVFSDWLEDNGDEQLPQIIRHVLSSDNQLESVKLIDLLFERIKNFLDPQQANELAYDADFSINGKDYKLELDSLKIFNETKWEILPKNE